MCCGGLLGWMHFAMEWKERMDEAVDGTNRSGHCRTGGNGRNSEKNELIKGIGSSWMRVALVLVITCL